MHPRVSTAWLLAAFVMCSSGVAAASLRSSAVVAASLRTLQQDALSNSNGCLATIPKCEAGACTTRDIAGFARWVCLRCVGNYEPVVDASGQDNIVQCVCPRGTYENDTISTTTCTRCGFNSYCPGGDRSETPATLGSALSCGSGLITRTNGARSQVDCVAPAGYSMFSPTEARACGTSEYAPKFNRLGRCLRCQSGLEETPGNITDPGLRSSKRAVCKVPPGKFMSQGLVRPCAQGFYREQYLDFDHANAAVCLPCNPGITTVGPASKTAAECNRVLPGYGVSTISSNDSPLSSQIPSQTANGLPAATLCPIGTYSQAAAGGYYCVQCPGNTVTRNQGAMAVEECAVPPGYFLPAGGNITQCLAGSFREGWVVYSDPKGASYTSCGAGITSEARDLDQNPLVTTTSYVRGSSSSCYIDAGQGMIAQGSNTFAGMDCPVNTYGAAGRVYGWASAPCKPCPRNMVTDTAKSNNSEACINPDGFGYASEGASRCAAGFYAARGTRRPCQRCASGRTTPFDPASQRFFTDCVVMAGSGVVSSTSNAVDAFSPNTTGLTPAQLANLPVLECPLGYYSAGGQLGSTCSACPSGSTTEGTGATSAANCTVCLPGFGIQTVGGSCAPCALGTYQAGSGTTCQACPASIFYPPLGSLNVPAWSVAISSSGTTLYSGSATEASCVPTQVQMSPEAGQAFWTTSLASSLAAATSGPPLVSVKTPTLASCITACANTALLTAQGVQAPGSFASRLCLTQYDGANCSIAALAPVASNSSAASRVYVKLPPASLGSASKVKASMMSSGFYAIGGLSGNPATINLWSTIGSTLTTDARTFAASAALVADTYDGSSVAPCKKLCDNSNVCTMFVASVTPTSVSCYYRGGIDALATRSFAALPASTAIAYDSLYW